MGQEDVALGSEEIIEELLDEIKDKGIKIGKWRIKDDRDCGHLYLGDEQTGGWYKLEKT